LLAEDVEPPVLVEAALAAELADDADELPFKYCSL